MDNLERKKPIWVATTIGQQMTKTLLSTYGTSTLDTYLNQLAVQSGKATGGVETVEDQCSIFNGLNNTLVCMKYLPTLSMSSCE